MRGALRKPWTAARPLHPELSFRSQVPQPATSALEFPAQDSTVPIPIVLSEFRKGDIISGHLPAAAIMLKRLFSHYIADEVRPMLSLAIPLVMAELGWMTMSVVDTMMVGRQADSAVAIGAVSVANVAYYVVAIFGTGLMLGLDTLVSHSYGAGDLHDAHRSLVNGVYLSLGLAPVLMGVVRLWELVLRSIDIQPSVLNQAIPYLRALN